MSPYLRRLRDAMGPQLLVLPSVTGIVYDVGGAILLVRQRDVDLWSTPGGSLEPGETPADGVVREVWEETGLYTEPRRILAVYGGAAYTVSYPNGDQAGYVTTVFECVGRGGTLTRTSEEVSEATFVGATELQHYALTPWAQRVLPVLYQRSAETRFDAPTWRPYAGAI
jgi:8-oxo-dGTP pyrophosphatase MutT (NUDIX family)